MKTCLPFLYGILVTMAFCNATNKTAESTSNKEKENNVASSKTQTSLTEINGQWKKIAGGEDSNKNRILDEAEIIRHPEPGLYDSIDFAYGRLWCRFNGMNMQFEGPYTIKSTDGKKKIFVYPTDMDQGLTPAEQDKQALRFEIVSLEPNKLVLIPPVYEFMLIVYARAK